MEKKPTDDLIKAYEFGKSVRELSWDEIFLQIRCGEREELPDKYFLNPIYSLFIECGRTGRPMPKWVKGWRYGEIPAEGFSTNFREGKAEAGISIMELLDGTRSQDKISALFISVGRPIIWVEGWLHFKRGGDGEPLLVGAVESLPE